MSDVKVPLPRMPHRSLSLRRPQTLARSQTPSRRPTQRRSRIGGAAGATAMLVATLVGAPATVNVLAATPAQALDQSLGTPGFCKTSTGVTVVIDFQALGGETIVRCNPSGARGTGLDALKGAGIQVSGALRWGEAFICRVENRPSAVETVPVAGAPGYKEACINTPPAAAYWSYWHAGNNCAWSYSQWGVKNRDFVQGGFEAWSFSLDATSETTPRPRVAAVRPGTEGGKCVTPVGPGPTTNDPNESQPGSVVDTGAAPDPDYGKDGQKSDNPYDPDNADSAEKAEAEAKQGRNTAGGSGRDQAGVPPGAAPRGSVPNAQAAPGSANSPGGSSAPGPSSSTDGSASSSTDGSASAPTDGSASAPTNDKGAALPPPLPRSESTPPGPAADPAKNVAFSGGQQLPDVDDAVKQQVGASDVAPWAAGAAVLALVGLGVYTARRRRVRAPG